MSHRAASHLLLVTLKCGPGHIYMVPSVGEEPIDPENLYFLGELHSCSDIFIIQHLNPRSDGARMTLHPDMMINQNLPPSKTIFCDTERNGTNPERCKAGRLCR